MDHILQTGTVVFEPVEIVDLEKVKKNKIKEDVLIDVIVIKKGPDIDSSFTKNIHSSIREVMIIVILFQIFLKI